MLTFLKPIWKNIFKWVLTSEFILKIKDLYFDIPKAHIIKNLITGLFSDVDEKIYDPSHTRTHRNYYVFNRDPYILTVLESINDLQISVILKLQ